MAYDSTRKIIAAAPQLTQTLLIEFGNFFSLVAERIFISKTRYHIFLRESFYLCCTA